MSRVTKNGRLKEVITSNTINKMGDVIAQLMQ